jgi:hypothetical protein
VHLYQFKFSEHFGNHADAFFQKIWEQITNNKLQAERECERLIFAIVHYIGDAAGLPNYTQLIKENLPALFQVVVIPNISLTE